MAAALAVAPPRPAAAQETGGPSYAQRHWTAEDGLPVNSVRDLAQGPQGYLWAATYVGLVRYTEVDPGTYTLVVRAIVERDAWGEPARLTVTVAPFW